MSRGERGLWGETDEEDPICSPEAMRDEEPLIEDSEHSRVGSDEELKSPHVRRVAVVTGLATLLVGTVAFVACGAFGLQSYQSEGPPAAISARMLFESPEFAEVATDNAMEIGRDTFGPSDRDDVRADVTASINNISRWLQKEYPATYKALDQVPFTGEERCAMLDMMRRLSDPRVQSLGRDVGLAVGEARSMPGAGREAMKRSIMARLSPSLDSIRKLRDEVEPAILREDDEDSAGGDDGLQVTLDPERMDFMQTFDDWSFEVRVTRAEETHKEVSTALERRLKGAGGMSMMLHFTKLLRKAKKIAKRLGFKIPNLGKIFKQLDMKKLMSCAMSQMMKVNFKKLWKCGMQFAHAASDAFHGVKSSGTDATASSKGGGGGGLFGGTSQKKKKKGMFGFR